jgi:hypothetical protein
MLVINYPEPAFRIKKENNKDFLFDPLRKKWLLLTPEEWVRQNFVQYLIQVRQYPAALIALEKEIWLGELKKRFDILVYNSDHKPWMIVECKAESILLNDETVQQALRYNISVPVEFIFITNGSYTYGWQKRGGQLNSIDELPAWEMKTG